MRTVSLQNVTNAEKLPSNNATISKPSEIWVVVEGEYEGGYPDTSKFTKDNMYLMDLNMRIEKKKQDAYLSRMDLSRPPVFKIAMT